MSPGRGWTFFIVGVLLSTFFGGAIRVVYSPARIKDFVLARVAEKNPKFQIEFSHAELSLARGLVPQLAIVLSDVRIHAKDKCVTEDEIQMERFAIPLAFRSLFQPGIYLGVVRATEVQYWKRAKNCVAEKVEEDEIERDGIAPIESFFKRRWTKEVVNTTRYIDEFTVDRLHYHAPDGQKLFVLEDVSIAFDKKLGASMAEFELRPESVWTGGEPFGPTHVQLRVVAESIYVEGDGNLKEGQFEIKGAWDVESGGYNYSLEVTDLPLQNTLGFARHWGAFPTLGARLRNQWMSCVWSGQGQVRSLFKELDLDIRRCRMYGDLGEMRMRDAELAINADSGPFPVVVELENVPVRQGLEAFGIGTRWGLVSEFGTFRGQLLLASAHELELIGHVRDAELYLSSPAGRTRQKVKSFYLKLAYDETRFSGIVEKIEVEQGQILGQVSFNVSLDGEGVIQLALADVQLPLETQRVLIGGRTQKLEIFGLGAVSAQGLNSFEGKMGFADLDTHQWRMEKLKVDVALKENIWQLVAAAEKFHTKPESKWRVLGFSLLSESENRPKEFYFDKLSASVSLAENKGAWSDLKASLVGIQLKSAGQWNEKGALTGSIEAIYPSQKNQRWQVEGSFSHPTIK